PGQVRHQSHRSHRPQLPPPHRRHHRPLRRPRRHPPRTPHRCLLDPRRTLAHPPPLGTHARLPRPLPHQSPPLVNHLPTPARPARYLASHRGRHHRPHRG